MRIKGNEAAEKIANKAMVISGMVTNRQHYKDIYPAIKRAKNSG